MTYLARNTINNNCSRHEGSGPADLPGNQEGEQEEEL
jgi:hypothetical protein